MPTRNDSISALLPVKNGQEYLTFLLPSILSMLNQTDDLIVVNDGSTDSSRDLIEEFVRIDSRIKLINTDGVGLVSALNLGVDASEKSWIARFDVDDSYSKTRLDQQRKLAVGNVALIFSDYEFMGRNGKTLGRVYSAISPIATALSLITGQRTAHPVVLINRKLLLKCGGYDKSDFPVEDLALWLKISKFGGIVSVPSLLLYYRLSDNSISAKNRKIQNLKKAQIINDFDSWQTLHTKCLNDFKETISLYETFPHSSQRIFLHLRDLAISGKQTGTHVPFIKLLKILGVMNSVKVAMAGFKISVRAIYRRIYRFTLKFS
jgi:glycosyltransferase involved in cell wall biosynthesis